jgi:hypothetical protein
VAGHGGSKQCGQARFPTTSAEAKWVLAVLQIRCSGEMVVDVCTALERATKKDPSQTVG